VVKLFADDYHEGMMTIEHWWNQAGTLDGLRQPGDVLEKQKN
jgi:hypothetical protein